MSRQPHAYRVEPFDPDRFLRAGFTDPKLWVQAIGSCAILLLCFVLLFVQTPA
jgi:hypothetical protein